MTPPSVIGWYAASWKLVGILTFPATMPAAALYPTLSRLHDQRSAIYTELLAGALKAAVLVGVLSAAGTYLFADIAVALVYGQAAFAPAADNLKLLAGYLLLVFVNITLGAAVMAAGLQTRWILAKLLAVVARDRPRPRARPARAGDDGQRRPRLRDGDRRRRGADVHRRDPADTGGPHAADPRARQGPRTGGRRGGGDGRLGAAARFRTARDGSPSRRWPTSRASACWGRSVERTSAFFATWYVSAPRRDDRRPGRHDRARDAVTDHAERDDSLHRAAALGCALEGDASDHVPARPGEPRPLHRTRPGPGARRPAGDEA